jgi:hypothetical protein
LFLHKSISIPGLGTIYMEAIPASADQASKQMLPPLYYFRFDKYFDAPNRQFFTFLATQQDIADYEALRMYNEFSYDLREKINHEEKVTWEGVGELKRDGEGNIVFESILENPDFLRPVPARKVIHPDANHMLLVGDSERSSEEMNEWLHQGQDNTSKRPWWLFALVAAIISILVLLFHFSYNGWNSNAAGNQQKLEVEK